MAARRRCAVVGRPRSPAGKEGGQDRHPRLGAREHGLSALTDQQIAGGMMLGLDVVVMLCSVGFFFYRSAQDDDRAHEPRRSAEPAEALTIRAWNAALNASRAGPG